MSLIALCQLRADVYTVDETDAEHIAGRPDSQTRSATNYKDPLLYLHHSRGASSKFGELSCWLVTHCNLPEADLFPGPPRSSTANRKHWTNAVLILVQRRRRWANIKTALVDRLMLLDPRKNLEKILTFRQINLSRALVTFSLSSALDNIFPGISDVVVKTTPVTPELSISWFQINEEILDQEVAY